MKPLDELGFVELANLLDHGTITLADGRVLMQVDEHDYLLRGGADGDLHFKWFGEVERYLAFHGATFHHIVVDAEDARAQRIERRRQK